ncbi:Peptidase M20 domain-containing protein 2 [Fusarium oxysporum f. sp. cubense]|uniref:Peptidase M20 domain-containing protein 2 n=1 Tax=Fusarium oxysporum f. sp. cubense TaxID=61366 RepID=A0A559LWL5_FUSOC|nr:Peptidase M20 domain-containing protein 2 [Fusarium oxysporum f. sp. cubense]
MQTIAVDMEEARKLISSRIDEISPDLYEKVNKPLHANPETALQEFLASQTLASWLEEQGFNVKRSTYGLETSFEASFGQGGRQVVLCAEYDALPEIGHACGHNLIATASLAAFIGATHVMGKLGLSGRLRILGTPAEEDEGGKAKLLEGGAFDPPESIAAAVMVHPLTKQFLDSTTSDISGLAGFKTLACHHFQVEFHGVTAHAAGEPWNGTNALDAAVAAYQNAALLRQQVHPDERIHSIFEVAGTVNNVISDYTRMSWTVRSPTIARADRLLERVRRCIEAGASATGCTTNFIPFVHTVSCAHIRTLTDMFRSPTYANMRANATLCEIYAKEMDYLGKKVVALRDKPLPGSTDMGNVSYAVPSFHGTFTIPTSPDVAMHNRKFAAAAGTYEAHTEATISAKGLAMLAVQVLVNDNVANAARLDFENLEDA